MGSGCKSQSGRSGGWFRRTVFYRSVRWENLARGKYGTALDRLRTGFIRHCLVLRDSWPEGLDGLDEQLAVCRRRTDFPLADSTVAAARAPGKEWPCGAVARAGGGCVTRSSGEGHKPV